jgi:hypothetical protein
MAAELARRAFLAGSAALAALPVPARAAPDMARAIRRLRFRTDEGLVFWWLRCSYYGNVNAALTPLYGMIFGSIQQVINREDGGFDVLQLELGFRMELDGKIRMREFRNPYTGETVPVQFTPVGPTRLHFSADVIPSVGNEFGGSRLEFNHFPEAPYVAGGTFFAPFRAASRVITQGSADRYVNDVALFHGPANKALDPKVKSAPAWLNASDVGSWPRWMRMGDRPGSTVLRAVGGKAMRLRDMPEDWLDMVREFDATILADPLAALQRPQATYKG